jgi:uncharacterized membrane protein
MTWAEEVVHNETGVSSLSAEFRTLSYSQDTPIVAFSLFDVAKSRFLVENELDMFISWFLLVAKSSSLANNTLLFNSAEGPVLLPAPLQVSAKLTYKVAPTLDQPATIIAFIIVLGLVVAIVGFQLHGVIKKKDNKLSLFYICLSVATVVFLLAILVGFGVPSNITCNVRAALLSVGFGWLSGYCL